MPAETSPEGLLRLAERLEEEARDWHCGAVVEEAAATLRALARPAEPAGYRVREAERAVLTAADRWAYSECDYPDDDLMDAVIAWTKLRDEASPASPSAAPPSTAPATDARGAALTWPSVQTDSLVRQSLAWVEAEERKGRTFVSDMVRALCERAAMSVSLAPERGVERLCAERQDGNRPVAWDRDTLGRFVREAWVRWAMTQPNPKPSWLVPYDDLAEPDKEADRQIGEAVARWTLVGDAALAARVTACIEPAPPSTAPSPAEPAPADAVARAALSFEKGIAASEAALRSINRNLAPPDFDALTKARLLVLLESAVDQRFWPPRPTRQDKVDLVEAFKRAWRHGSDAERKALLAALARTEPGEGGAA